MKKIATNLPKSIAIYIAENDKFCIVVFHFQLLLIHNNLSKS